MLQYNNGCKFSPIRSLKKIRGKEVMMKTFVKVIAILSLLFTISCAETEKKVQKIQSVPEPQLYTAYNIWKIRKPFLRRCINYKYGNDIIPAGTEVRKAKIEDDVSGTSTISFVTVKDNHKYNIYFKYKWHPGKTIEDYKNYMFTTKTFEELTAGMSEDEINAIKNGIVINGMSKKAVLVNYGYPPEHRTSSLDRDRWIYWRNKMQSFAVCFDENGRTTFCR